MGIKVELKPGERPESLVRRFDKVVEKSGIMREMRKREFYEKPSDRARRDRVRQKKNIQREAKMAERREGGW